MIKLKSILTENITDTPEFKRWFRHSQVVDKHGNPMVVFHGTKSSIKSFSKKRMGYGSTVLGNYEIERYGIFAAEDSQLADEFARAGDYDHEESFGHSIIPLYMRIEAPFDTTKISYSDALFNTVEEWGNNHKEWFDNKEDEYNGYRLARFLGNIWGSNKIWMLFDKDEGNDPEMWISMLKDFDYDGVRLYERSEVSNNISWMAFDPDQVKSAIGNSGNFDADDLDITKESKFNESMFPREFDRKKLGSCMSAAALATDYLLSKGILNFKIIEGWVSFDDDYEIENGRPYGNIAAHTWIQFTNGRIFDPTKFQWIHWGYDPSKVKYIPDIINKEYTPAEYQSACNRQ